MSTTDLEQSLGIVAKGAVAIFIGTIIGQLLGLLNQIILGRFLWVESYGQFNLALSIIEIISSIAIFGLFGGLSRFIPFHLARGEKAIVKSSIRFSLVFVLCISILIGAVMFIFSERLATNIFHDGDLHIIFRYFFIGLPLVTIPGVLAGVLRGFKAVKHRVVIYNVVEKLVKIVIFIPFLLIGYRLFGAIVAYLTAMISSIVISIFIIRKKLLSDYSEVGTVSIGKKLLSFSWPLALTGMTFIFASRTDTILLGYYLTSIDVGIYTPALVITGLLNFVPISFVYIFLPVISGLFAKGKIVEIESLFKSTSKWMSILTLPLLIYILLFSKEIIILLFGYEYSTGYLALVILSFGISFSGFTGLTGNILVGGGHTKTNLACEIIAAITNISLNLLLIPTYGIIGAAIGTSASYFMRNIAFLIFVYKINKMHPFKKNYVSIALSGLIVFISFYLIKTQIYPFSAEWIDMIVAVILILGFYIILILFFRCLDKNDKFVLKLITKRLGLNIKMLDRL